MKNMGNCSWDTTLPNPLRVFILMKLTMLLQHQESNRTLSLWGTKFILLRSSLILEAAQAPIKSESNTGNLWYWYVAFSLGGPKWTKHILKTTYLFLPKKLEPDILAPRISLARGLTPGKTCEGCWATQCRRGRGTGLLNTASLMQNFTGSLACLCDRKILSHSIRTLLTWWSPFQSR